jgi:hypothetical protein
MTINQPLRIVRQIASLFLALFILNFFLTFHNVWPTLAITTRFELSVEIAILILTLAIFAYFRHLPSNKVLIIVALMLTVMTVARYMEVTAPALFGRGINLYWDAQYIPHVAQMLVEATSPLQLIGLIIGALILLITIFYLLLYSLRCICSRLKNSKEHHYLTAIMSVLTIAYFMGHINQPIHTLKYFSLPLTKTYWSQLQFIKSVMIIESTEVLAAGDHLGNFNLARLEQNDIFIEFIESYGATVFDNETFANDLRPALKNLESQVEKTGRRIVSAFIQSPTFGGNSWLSHASFMTGLNVDHLATYNLLMTQSRTTLTDKFRAQGYRSVALMPGLRADWPEGTFYGFDDIYGEQEINYQGPDFGWWRIPDQYSLHRFHQLEVIPPSRQPLFLFFTAITPHMPFRPTPPYQPDWNKLDSEQPFEQEKLLQSLSLMPEWTNLGPSYTGTLNYTFDYISGYLANSYEANLTWVLLGDHQPVASVSGIEARWDVPIHIISRNDEIIDSLIALGFTEGIQPEPQPITTMHEIPSLLLGVFSR